MTKDACDICNASYLHVLQGLTVTLAVSDAVLTFHLSAAEAVAEDMPHGRINGHIVLAGSFVANVVVAAGPFQ